MSLWNIRITDRFHAIQTAPVLLCIMKRSDIMNWEGTLWIENIKLEVPRVFQQPRHQIFMKFYDSKKNAISCHLMIEALKKTHPRLLGRCLPRSFPVVPFGNGFGGKPEELCKVQRCGGIFGAQLQHVLREDMQQNIERWNAKLQTDQNGGMEYWMIWGEKIREALKKEKTLTSIQVMCNMMKKWFCNRF